MKKIIFSLLFVLLTLSSLAQIGNIEETLSNLSDVEFKKYNETDNYKYFVLKVKQPLDHSDESKGFFNQKVYLSHTNIDKPAIMVTAGYNVNRNRPSELTNMLGANQLMVEHRFFGESLPDSMDYHYLNLEQATADLHHIKELFSSIYKNKWLSTGISKGGATTIAYRYFYPDDVDVSVPYVAPINIAYEEPRIYHFLDTVGSDECRAKIKDFQIRILQNRDNVLPLLKFYSIGARASYEYLSLEEAFEYAVMEYPFSFWQWGSQCNEIPDESASVEEMTKYLIDVSGPTFFSDQSIQQYTSHYYQSATEFGYYGYETNEFKEYLVDLPTETNPMALFYSFEMKDEFNSKLLKDLNKWLKKKGDKFLYIYGANDTWSASAVPPNDKVDSEWFMLAGKHHGNARIKSMTPTERTKFVSTLEKWLSIEIE